MATVYHLASEFACRGCGELDDSTQKHTLPKSNSAGVQHVVVDMAMPEDSRVKRVLSALVPGVNARTRMDPDRRACTLLYAGLGPDVRSGDYIVLCGRKIAVPDSVVAGKLGEESWKWYEKHIRARRQG